MENEDKEINLGMLSFVAVQLIITIILVISFQNVLAPDKIILGMKIDEIAQEVDGLSEDNKELLEFVVYNAVAKNITDNNVRLDGAIVRDGSLKNTYFEEVDINFVSFIVDIPDAKRSYQVVYEWSDDEENMYVPKNDAAAALCLESDQLIYGDFNCDHSKDWWRRYYASTILQAYGNVLPGYRNMASLGEDDMNDANETIFEVGGIASTEGEFASDDFKVKLGYMICESQCECYSVDEDKKNRVIVAYKEFLDRIGFTVEQVPYYFDNCQ